MYYVRWLIYRRFRLAAEFRHNAKKLLQHQRDLLTTEGSDDLQKHIDQLAQVMCSSYNRSDLDAAIEKLQQVGSHRLIAYKSPGIRENVEVCLSRSASQWESEHSFSNQWESLPAQCNPRYTGLPTQKWSRQKRFRELFLDFLKNG